MEISEIKDTEKLKDWNKIIGFQIAVLSVFLTVFSTLAFQGFTRTMLAIERACNDWAQYRITSYQMGMSLGIIKQLDSNSIDRANMLADYANALPKYRKELDEIRIKADAELKEEKVLNRKSSLFDFSAFILGIGVTLTSFYFLTRQNFFPVLGLVSGLVGAFIGLATLLLIS